MGTSLMALGQVDQGAGKLREALDLAVAHKCLPEMRAAYINLADLLHQRGRSDEARAVAHDGAERTTGTGGYSSWVSTVEAEIALDTGDWAYAERHLPDPGPVTGTTFVNFALRHAELALGQGDAARARSLLDDVDVAAVNIDEPQFLGVMGALRAELERRAGDLDAARAAIRRALDRIETCTDDVVRLARVAAVGVVVEADAAQRAGDLGDDEARRRALLEADFHLGRTAAAAQEDPFGLTPRERQVLVLVAEGRTNREIGDSLFMAEKTASVHVSRILAKLDVRSRTEAAAVAHRLGLDGDVAATRPG
jgi:ATP/maltotriose-dependent transcriptional regulator MalT